MAAGGFSKTVAAVQQGEIVKKDDLLDVLYWVKQAAAIACGLVCGFLPALGLQAFLAALVAGVGIVFLFCRSYLRLDDEEYGGFLSLLGDSGPVAVAAFLLTWVVSYNAIHDPAKSLVGA